MATKWKDIRKTHSPEGEAEIARRVQEAAGVMTLYQVREARSLTQVNLARVLNINQGAVSRMEKRTDMYVSTLRNFIQAMGGKLQIKAIFPEAEIEIDQFENLPQLPQGLSNEIEDQPNAEKTTAQEEISRAFPYDLYQGTDTWRTVERAIIDLVKNRDIAETTPREYIVGYICKQFEEREAQGKRPK